MSKKVSKESVDYRPSKGSKRCGNCSMYSGNSTGICSLVAGPIRAEDVCKRWERTERGGWHDYER